MKCPSASRHFRNHSIKLLLVDAGGRGRCHIVKVTCIVRHLAYHLTAECITSCICNFSRLYRLCYDGPFTMKSCPKTLIFIDNCLRRYKCICIFYLHRPVSLNPRGAGVSSQLLLAEGGGRGVYPPLSNFRTSRQNEER